MGHFSLLAVYIGAFFLCFGVLAQSGFFFSFFLLSLSCL